MIENLKIENFGPIKSVNLDLKKVFILIGPQSSGKSVIAKLIAIFRDWDFVVDRIPFTDLLKKHNIDTYINEKSITKYTSDAFTFIYKEGNEEFSYNESHKLYEVLKKYKKLLRGKTLSTLSSDKDTLETTVKEAEDIAKKLQEYSGDDLNKSSELLDKIKDLLNQSQILTNKFLEEEPLIEDARLKLLRFVNFSEYIPAERILIPIISNSTLSFNKLDIPIPKNLIDFGSSFEKAREVLEEIDISFLNIKYKFLNNENRVYLKGRKTLLLNKASSGFQAVIPMLLVIAHLSPNPHSGNTFVIEEPEQNLFPETQSHLVKFLTEHCANEDRQSGNFNELVITTHSPYILTAFNNLLLAYKVSAIEDLGSEVENIIPNQFWINPKNFNAYYIEKGKAKQIFNEQVGLISENELDSASEFIMDEFNQLMELRRSKRYAK